MRWWLGTALIALAGTLVYWNSVSAPFTFDDQVSVVDNAQIRHLWPLWAALSPPAGGWPVSGRPLVNLSFAINYALGELNVRGYHAVNIGLHVCCALLLFGIVRRTLAARVLPDRRGPAGCPEVRRREAGHCRPFAAGTASDLALVCALIWTLHPLQTETIDYVSKRSELMMSLFYLLTVYGGVRAIGSERARSVFGKHEHAPGVWLLVSVLSSAMGMACKESMVTAPLIVLLYDVTFVFGSLREALRRRGRFYGGLAATWLVLGALIWSGPRADTAGFSSRLSSWTYLLNQSAMIVRYLHLAFWPRSFVLDYGEPLPLTLAAAAPYVAAIIILLLVTAVALARYPTVGFFGAWFFIVLAPTSSFIPIASEVGAESRMYLPLAAIVGLTVIAGFLLCRRLSNFTHPEGRRWPIPSAGLRARQWIWGGAVTAVVFVCGTLAVGTVGRNAEYQSDLTLWRTVVERWPHARAHRNLAQALKNAGYREEVVFHLREAIRDQPEVRYALGQVLFDQGNLSEAIEELRRAIGETPADSNVISARVLLGRALASRGQRAEAAREFRLVLQATPSDVVAQGGLADALFAQGDFEGAGARYVEYLKSRPDNASAWHYLGVALFRTGHKDQAAQALRRAVELNAEDGQAQRNLASVLLDLRDLDGALRHAELAVGLMPGDAAAHTMLGVALVRQGRLDEAIGHFRTSLEIEPAQNDAREYLANALIERASRPGR